MIPLIEDQIGSEAFDMGLLPRNWFEWEVKQVIRQLMVELIVFIQLTYLAVNQLIEW